MTKRKLIFLMLLMYINIVLWGLVIEVNQDGSGNYTIIQEAMNSSANGDTVLVYPGTYYENLNFQEKSITLTSLYSFTQEDSIISNTIIDGNQEYRCITIEYSDNAVVNGFTIQNGSAMVENGYGYMGGGIYLKQAVNITISNCIIRDNKSYDGGGVAIIYCINVNLIGNTIAFNHGLRYGGSIASVGNELTLIFNETNLNNIYFNYSGTGSDIFLNNVLPTNVVVDTFTVENPDYYYITSRYEHTFFSLNSKFEG